MAIALVVEFPGGTQQQYDRSVAALDLQGHTMLGALFHVAGPCEGGWRVVDVWESQEAFDRFVGEHLAPLLPQLGLTPPTVTAWPVHTLLTA